MFYILIEFAFREIHFGMLLLESVKMKDKHYSELRVRVSEIIHLLL